MARRAGNAEGEGRRLLVQLLVVVAMANASGLGLDGLDGGSLLVAIDDADCDGLARQVGSCESDRAATRGTTCRRLRSEYARRFRWTRAD